MPIQHPVFAQTFVSQTIASCNSLTWRVFVAGINVETVAFFLLLHWTHNRHDATSNIYTEPHRNKSKIPKSLSGLKAQSAVARVVSTINDINYGPLRILACKLRHQRCDLANLANCLSPERRRCPRTRPPRPPRTIIILRTIIFLNQSLSGFVAVAYELRNFVVIIVPSRREFKTLI